MPATEQFLDKALSQARALAETGDLAQAEHIYEAVLARFPDNADAHDGLQAVRRPPDRTQGAGLTREQADALLSLYNRHRLAEARQMATALAAQNPGVPFLQNLLGAIHNGLGHPEQAVDNYRRAVALQPDLAEAHNNLGDTLIALGQHGDALATLNEALALAPDHPLVHFNIGHALGHLRRHAQAVDSYREAIRLRPELAEAHNGLGVSLAALGHAGEAIASFEAAVELRPDYAEAHNNLALAERAAGRTQEALDHCLAAIRANPAYAEAHNNLALCLDALGRPEEAITNLRRAIGLKPDYAQAHSNLCELLDRLGRTDELSAAIQHARADCLPDDPRILYRAGQLAMRQRDFEQARACLDAIRPEALPARLRQGLFRQLGRSCDKLHDYPAAFSHFEAANRQMKALPDAEGLDPASHVAEIEALTAAYQAMEEPENGIRPALEILPPPVFFVGFPRSGMTLIDPLLGANAGLAAIDDQPMVPLMRQALGKAATPERLAAFGEVDIAALRHVYRRELDIHAGGASHGQMVFDRRPLNLVHAGLIHRVFPTAKFVFWLRHPCDCVLSCFMHDFALDDITANFLELGSSAVFYDRVMALWLAIQDRLPLDVHYVRYEEMAANPDAATAALLDFLEIDADSARPAGGSPFLHQTAERLYTQAGGRWEHYGAQMEPVLPVLEGWARKWGYS